MIERLLVRFLSNVYNPDLVDTPRVHHETDEATKKPLVMTKYNKYMSGEDTDDQLLT